MPCHIAPNALEQNASFLLGNKRADHGAQRSVRAHRGVVEQRAVVCKHLVAMIDPRRGNGARSHEVDVVPFGHLQPARTGQRHLQVKIEVLREADIRKRDAVAL